MARRLALAPRLSLEEIALDLLDLDELNVNTHSPAQVAQIAASVASVGFLDPVGVTPRGDRYLVLEGEGRVLAARHLGRLTVPCMVVRSLSDQAARAYALAHNQSQRNTGLDMAVVEEEFVRLGVTESDFPSLGFTADDLIFFGDDARLAGSQSHAGSTDDWAEHVAASERYTLLFQDASEQSRFLALLDAVLGEWPAEPTVAARLAAYARAQLGES